MKRDDMMPDQPVRPQKAYKNLGFLNSPDARTTRVLCEFIEPETRFERMNIRQRVGVCVSGRTLPGGEASAR